MMLLERVRTRLSVDGREATLASVAQALRHEGVVVGDLAALELVQALRDDLVGAGPLQSLLDDPDVTDVIVNGPHDVCVDRGHGLELTPVQFSSVDDIRLLAQRLASSVGRRLDDAAPTVDARLRDGTRLHAVLPPIAVGCTLVSLRKPARQAMSLADLVKRGTVDEHGAKVLESLIASRASFLISGGTGAGKTTILNCLLGLIDSGQRTVIVEDSTELHPAHPQIVRLQSRQPNAEGAGAVPLRDLVRQALRMRPDRIVVGEVRGAEVLDLLIAFNTGHEGSAGTVHANSASDVPARLAALGLLANVDRLSIHALINSGLSVVVHVSRECGRRVIESINVLRVEPDGSSAFAPAWVRRCGVLEPGQAHEQWQRLIAQSLR